MPQKASLPAITYQQTGGARNHTLEGTDNMTPSVWRFNCWSETYSEAETVAQTVKAALDDYTGTASGVTIQNAHYESDTDLLEQRAGTDQLTRFGKGINFNVWYNE